MLIAAITIAIMIAGLFNEKDFGNIFERLFFKSDTAEAFFGQRKKEGRDTTDIALRYTENEIVLLVQKVRTDSFFDRNALHF